MVLIGDVAVVSGEDVVADVDRLRTARRLRGRRSTGMRALAGSAIPVLEGALERSLVRSDEQLAYYVAQAREVVDLSLSAQRQITVDLQRLAGADAA